MSLTRTVLALVPSDFHSSRPWVPSSAAKNNFPFTAVKWAGPSPGFLRLPGVMFLTRTVPALVRSDFHSSRPWVPSLAVKNNLPRIAVSEAGLEPVLVLGLMSLTRTVPALVPSDFHSSWPWVPSSAVKNNVPPTSANSEGLLERAAGTGHGAGVPAALPATTWSVSALALVVYPADAATPAKVTAAAAAVAARVAPAPRARRRSTLAWETRARTTFFFAHRCRRLMHTNFRDTAPHSAKPRAAVCPLYRMHGLRHITNTKHLGPDLRVCSVTRPVGLAKGSQCRG